MQNKKAKNKRNSRQKGFSLIEVLIAIAILAAITIPLAMNMISTSQINSKSKSTSTAADLSASVLESMQSVNLSDLLVEMNGYDTNEYGEKLAYSIADNSLHGFTVGNKFEARVSEEGKKSYVPVQKQTDGMADSLVTSSIKVRKTNNDDVIKTYFTGHKDGDGKIDNSYSVVMQDVHNDEDSFDIVMDIKEGQSYDMANINAMNQSDIVSMFESSADTEDVIRTILDNTRLGDVNEDDEVNAQDATTIQRYLTNQQLEGKFNENLADIDGDGTITIFDTTFIQKLIEKKYEDLNMYTKEYIINIQQDSNTEATNIIIDCKYHIAPNFASEEKKAITKRIGTFSTNSTFEFAKGIYLYYNPHQGDKFVIENRNELSTAVYLIASTPEGTSIDTMDYHPSITINELSSQVYADSARTTVCSNIEDDKWTPKTVVPAKNNPLKIKTLANVGSQQTLYNVSVKIYKHNKASFNADNVFEPNEKNLLIQTDGSFLDNSVMHDIDSNKTTGIDTADKLSTVTPEKVVYNGEIQRGYTAANVTLTGDTEKINAGRYTVFATPNTGYAWADGTTKQKAFDWEIQPLKAAKASIPSGQSKFVYDGQIHSPVVGEHVTINERTGKNVGQYTAEVRPETNYAWEDAAAGKETETRYIYWEITPKPVTIDWIEYTWPYNGNTHIAKCKVHPEDLINGDRCDVILSNHMITEITNENSNQKATIVGLTNQNYTLAKDAEKEKLLQVTADNLVTYSSENYVYDGQEHEGIKIQSGNSNQLSSCATFTGTVSAINAGKYEATITLKKGYKWADGSSDSKTINWEISPRTASINWDVPSDDQENCKIKYENGKIKEVEWTYDGKIHFIGYKSIMFGESVVKLTPELIGNSITNVGSTTVYVKEFDDNNYTCSDEVILTVNPAIASYEINNDLVYNGQEQNALKSYNNVVVNEEANDQTENITSLDSAFTKIKADDYEVSLKPAENYKWSDGTNDAKIVKWTIKPAPKAWVDGIVQNGDKYEFKNPVYQYSADGTRRCVLGEQVKLSWPANSDRDPESIKTDTDENGFQTTWVELQEKGTYTINAEPIDSNYDWVDSWKDPDNKDNKTRTIEFTIESFSPNPAFNVLPAIRSTSSSRFYNGNTINPYLTDLMARLWPINKDLKLPNDFAGTVYEKITFTNDALADAEKMKPGEYALTYNNGGLGTQTYNWKIKKRPIYIKSADLLDVSPNITINDIKENISNSKNVQANTALIDEAIAIGESAGLGVKNDIKSLIKLEGTQNCYAITWDGPENWEQADDITCKEMKNFTVTDVKDYIMFVVEKEFKAPQEGQNESQNNEEQNMLKTHLDKLSTKDLQKWLKSKILSSTETIKVPSNGVICEIESWISEKDCQVPVVCKEGTSPRTAILQIKNNVVSENSFTALGDNDRITDVDVSFYCDGKKVSKDDVEVTELVGNECEFKINSIKIMHKDDNGNETDVTSYYEIDLDEAKGKITFKSNGQSTLEGGSDIAINIISQNAILIGDVDLNGTIDPSDAACLENYLASAQNFNTEQENAADSNRDGKIQVRDLLMLKRYLLNNDDVDFDCKIGKYVILAPQNN